MATTKELRDALGTYGAARVQLKTVWGVWADEFCDSMLLRLITPVGKVKIHIWDEQINIDIGNTGAYTVDHDSDALKIIGERLGNKLVRDTDTV